MAYRISNKLQSDINKTLRNYNAKIKRVEKKGVGYFAPEHLTKKELLKDVNSSKDIRSKLRDLQLYSTKGIEGLTTLKGSKQVVSKYELNLIKKELSSIKRSTSLKIKKMQTTQVRRFGVKQPFYMSSIPEDEYQRTVDFRKTLNKDFNKLNKSQLNVFLRKISRNDRLAGSKRNMYYRLSSFRSWKDFGEFFGELNPDKRALQLRENYMKTFEFAKYYLTPEQYQELVNRFNDLTLDEFVKLFNTDRGIQEILELLSPNSELRKGDPETYGDMVRELINNLLEYEDYVFKGEISVMTIDEK